MSDCPFCKIIAKEIPAEIIYEDENSLAFLDINPRTLGHTMVIPKVHATDLTELPADKVEPLFQTVKKLDLQIIKALSAAGLTIGINQGKVSGQVVPHLHIHLLPRFLDDGGGSIHSAVNRPPEETVSETAARIRSSI
ncbi:MAG: HIT family protein [Anaplasmataceae bacterium]|nr:HIT family protein [Anaplasmataceae bacterium]